jgi:WD40 repeat protein
MRALLTLLLLAAVASAADSHPVVLAVAREGRIEAYEPYSLQSLGSIGVNHGVESISVSPEGRTLYVAQESQRGASDCCGLYSLNLETHNLCRFGSGMFAAPSPDGRILFAQQGSDNVRAYDAATLSPVAVMQAAGAYNLQPSPDGRWLLAITNSPAPSLHVFDVENQRLVRKIAIPSGPATGAWSGDRFYIFTYSAPGIGQLWTVKSDDTKLAAPKQIRLPDLHGACNEPVLLMLAGAPDRLFLAEAYGFKMDRRHACPDAAPGGIHVIDPSSGHVARIAPSVYVNRMIVSPDGRDLYVLQSGGRADAEPVRLLHIDARTGRTMANIALAAGEWSLALAHVPYPLIPRGYVRAALACPR